MRQNTTSRVRAGFTLVELLIVIGIIALLISILLPALNRARQAAQSTACKSLLRQYALASEMYVNDNDGWTVDIYKFLDYEKGLVRYLGQRDQLSGRIARCPGDQSTEDMGRLGDIGNTTRPEYKQYDVNGNEYSVKLSIGANENSTSGSLILDRFGNFKPRWVKRSTAIVKGVDPGKTMTWGDFQNNRDIGDRLVAIIGPGIMTSTTANDKMGSLAFRHRGTMNAAFLDGHVSEIRINKKMTSSGHDLAAGENWGIFTRPTGGTTSYGTYASHKVFQPFGPAVDGPGGGAVTSLAIMEGWELN